MTPQEALIKLGSHGDRNDYDDGAGGWFGWSVGASRPGTAVLRVTWQGDDQGDDGTTQEFLFAVTEIAS